MMEPVRISEGHNQVMPYLIIKNAGAFIDFTKMVFDAEVREKIMRDENTIMHAELKLGQSIIMLADATAQFSERTAGLFIYVDDCDSVYKKAIDNGATEVTPPADMNYGRSGGVKDPFGITWWITSV